MLTADLVHARKRAGELSLTKLDAQALGLAKQIAQTVLAVYAKNVGTPRDELEAALTAAVGPLDTGPNVRRTIGGLRKLAEDAATFTADDEVDPIEARRITFCAAAAARRALGEDGWFDRARVLSTVARQISEGGLELTPEALENALYADLRNAQRLVEAPKLGPETLLARWEDGQAQAVLLRAVRVTVWVGCRSAGAYRALFHKLKFLRLLHEIHPLPAEEKWPKGEGRGGYRIVIDGPFSMFESVTKYGLQLALVVPALAACDAFHLEAEVRWGTARTPLTFKMQGGARGDAQGELRLPDEVETLLATFQTLDTPWKVTPSPAILELPGVGLCIPDLVFEHPTGARVYLEVLGFWSRDAVWRRVELVEQGLANPILFAVGQRLRVREDVLPEDAPGALYVYKGTMSARVILERIEKLRARAPLTPPPASTAPTKAPRGRRRSPTSMPKKD